MSLLNTSLTGIYFINPTILPLFCSFSMNFSLKDKSSNKKRKPTLKTDPVK